MAGGAIRLPIVSKFDSKGITDAKTGLDRLGGFAKGAGAVVGGAFLAATVAVGAFGIQSLKAADESWKVAKALDQAAKNSGAFGNTEADIKKATGALADHAKQLSEITGIDDEVLLSIEKTWMAVPELASLGTAGIQNLAQVTADVAAGTGKDIESIGLAFVKIAGDEETALSKLTRAGVVLTDEQKNTYQSFLDVNDEVGAQAYLIEQLGAKYEGMAAASASPLDRINQMWTNFQETIGTALMPALEKLAPMLGTALNEMVADPEFQQFLLDIGQAFVDLLPSLMDLLPPFMDLVKVIVPVLIEWMPFLIELITALGDALGGSSGSGEEWAAIVGTMADVGIFLIQVIQNVVAWFGEQFKVMSEGGFSILGLVAPITVLISNIDNISKAVQGAIGWWNELWGLEQSKPVGHVNFNTYDGNGGLKLATGGVVLPRPGGTMATIGEAGQAEAVIPLDRLEAMISTKSGGGGGGYVININGGLASSADIGRAVVDAIKKFERTSGPVFASA